MLSERVQSAIVILVMLAGAFFLPSWGVLAVLLIICAIGLSEFYSLMRAAQIPHYRRTGITAGLLLIMLTWLSLHYGDAELSYDWEWFLLFSIVAGIFVREFIQKNNALGIQAIGATLFGVMYVAFMLNFLTKLLMAWGGMDGRWLVLYLIVIVKSSDIGAYFAGCHLGRHKLIPRISPAKTWEGCAGGLFAGVVASLIFYVLRKGNLDVVAVPLADAICLGLLLAVFGIIGDLAESLLKRAAGVKDSGTLFRGMGGILDVLDSLLFSAPALYVYSRLFLERLPH